MLLFCFLHQVRQHLLKIAFLKEKALENINARLNILTKYFPQTTFGSDFDNQRFTFCKKIILHIISKKIFCSKKI
jgi:hypothetical protein